MTGTCAPRNIKHKCLIEKPLHSPCGRKWDNRKVQSALPGLSMLGNHLMQNQANIYGEKATISANVVVCKGLPRSV